MAEAKQAEYHTVQKGDTLYNLVTYYYGGPLNKQQYLNKMIQLNHISNANLINVGDRIKLPHDVPHNWWNKAYSKRITQLQNKRGYKQPKPPHDTREDWMMVVIWIVIHEFNCKVVGGFVRDFIYRGEHPNDIDIVLPPGMTIQRFQGIMHKRMKRINVQFIKGGQKSIKGQLFKLSWSKGPLFDADFVPSNAFANGTYCDVDVSNLEICKVQGGDVKVRRRVTKIKPDINIQTITENILLKRCNVISTIWRGDNKAKQKLEHRLKHKYEDRGWRIMNKYAMKSQGLKW